MQNDLIQNRQQADNPLLGIVIIVASGLYTLRRETIHRRLQH